MNKNKIAITLGIVCCILTISIYVQVNTVKNINSTVSKTFEENNLRDEVLRWKERYDNISDELDKAEVQLAKVRENATKNDSNSSQKEEEITLNNNILGITNLVGQGVEIVVKDDPEATINSIGALDDISNHIVHDADLRRIVNELKNAGAEAISINGQRIVNSTAITCIGNVIKVNDEKITSPFTIKAIGLSESLIGLERPGSYIETMREYGLSVTMKKSNNIEIPKYTGLISSKYIKTQN